MPFLSESFCFHSSENSHKIRTRKYGEVTIFFTLNRCGSWSLICQCQLPKTYPIRETCYFYEPLYFVQLLKHYNIVDFFASNLNMFSHLIFVSQ
jgi:hypothetical protein